jgi:hypothetical protein
VDEQTHNSGECKQRQTDKELEMVVHVVLGVRAMAPVSLLMDLEQRG